MFNNEDSDNSVLDCTSTLTYNTCTHIGALQGKGSYMHYMMKRHQIANGIETRNVLLATSCIVREVTLEVTPAPRISRHNNGVARPEHCTYASKIEPSTGCTHISGRRETFPANPKFTPADITVFVPINVSMLFVTRALLSISIVPS